MTCEDTRAVLDEVAAGDRPLTGDLASHVASCEGCRGMLAEARAVETWLAEPPPAAPAAFTASVLRRVRGEAWQAEQTVDRFFNGVLVAGALLVGVGIWMFANATGLADLFRQASSALTSGAWSVTLRGDTHVAAYALSVVLLLTSAGVWWWIENVSGHRGLH